MSKRGSQSDEDQNSNKHLAEIYTNLTPLEEIDGRQTSAGALEGAMRVDESHLPVPDGIMESDSKHWLGVEAVVLIIAGLMLVFIAFITWQVSLMSGPAKP